MTTESNDGFIMIPHPREHLDAFNASFAADTAQSTVFSRDSNVLQSDEHLRLDPQAQRDLDPLALEGHVHVGNHETCDPHICVIVSVNRPVPKIGGVDAKHKARGVSFGCELQLVEPGAYSALLIP